jgi:hypothetical protein
MHSRPSAQSIFGVPKKPLPHVAPSDAPAFLHVPASADDEPAGPVGAVLSGYTQTRPLAHEIFGVPKNPVPHVPPS